MFFCIFGENLRITLRLINDSAVSYLDCFRLISTLLQDLVDPWRANTKQREGRNGFISKLHLVMMMMLLNYNLTRPIRGKVRSQKQLKLSRRDDEEEGEQIEVVKEENNEERKKRMRRENKTTKYERLEKKRCKQTKEGAEEGQEEEDDKEE